MKKLLAILLCLVMVLSMVACGEKHDSYASAREGLVDIHADGGKGWVTRGDEARGQNWGQLKCTPISKNVPSNVSPDTLGLRHTSTDFGALRIEVYRGEKEKGRKVMHLRGLEFGPPDRNRTCICRLGGDRSIH